jgi:hypothetical protein
VHAAFEVVQSWLSKFSQQHFSDLLQFAFADYYFGEPPDKPNPDYSDLPLFMPYFIYCWRPAGKKTLPSGDLTIAHAFLRRHGSELTEVQRQVVELGISQPFTFYEIRSVVRGEEFVLKELLTGTEHVVKERAGSANVRVGDIFYGQMAPMRNITTMAVNAGFLIPPKMKPEIVMLRQELRAENLDQPLTINDVLECEADVRDLFFYLRDRLYLPPTLVNTDGEPLVPQTLVFEVGSPQVALDALLALAKGVTREEVLESARYDADGSLREVTINWLKKGNCKHKSSDNTILGTVRVSGRSLKAEVNSNQRAARLREEIDKRMGLAATYKTTEVLPLDVAKMWAARGTKLAQKNISHEPIDPELQRAMREMLQKQIESWVREKIPALGGRTPLQAVKDPDGREMVEGLVLEYERSMSVKFPDGTGPDMSVLRRLLKLPPA